MFQRGDLAGAKAYFETALRLAPDLENARANLRVVEEKLGAAKPP